MIHLIADIIEKFGLRPAGSVGELKAQQFLKEKLETFAHRVEVQSFEAPLTAKFKKMKLYALLYWCSVAVYFVSPFTAFGLAVINAAVTFNDLMRNGVWLDFLFPRHRSYNLTATVEPLLPAKQTLIFSGHIDATEECRWWYWLKQWGGYLTIGCGVAIFLLCVFCFADVTARLLFHSAVFSGGIWLFVLLSPLQIIYFTFHSGRVVDGAADNLSGIAIAFSIIEHFSQNRLKHTRIRFISFAAEEKGLRGSKAYVKQNLPQLIAESSILINIDTIRLANHISIINKETMTGIKHDEQLAAELKKYFVNNGFSIRTNPLPMGGTDAAPFSASGISAVSVIGIDTKQLDPTYHTRLDTLQHIEPLALEHVKKALIDWVMMKDSAPL